MDVLELWDLLEPRLERIESKQDLTNGRIGKIELWKARVEGARAAGVTAWTRVLAFGGVVGALVGSGTALLVATGVVGGS